jgi:hypothetical protein
MHDIPNEKVTTDLIIGWLKEQVESKRMIAKEVWLDAAFKLNLLLGDEVHEAEMLRQSVAQGKLAILKAQEKRNVSAAEMEIEAGDIYRLMREQESKVERIQEFIRIAKKNVDQNL